MSNSRSAFWTHTFSSRTCTGSGAAHSSPTRSTHSCTSAPTRTATPGRTCSVSSWHPDHHLSTPLVTMMGEGTGHWSNPRRDTIDLLKMTDPPSLIAGPHAIYPLPLPATKPSPATKDSTTATTPWKPSTACSEDGPIKGPSIKWITTGSWIIRCPHGIPIWTVAPVWHSAETSAPSGHRTLS